MAEAEHSPLLGALRFRARDAQEGVATALDRAEVEGPAATGLELLSWSHELGAVACAYWSAGVRGDEENIGGPRPSIKTAADAEIGDGASMLGAGLAVLVGLLVFGAGLVLGALLL